MTPLVECETCAGAGEIIVEWSTANEHGQDTRECDACNGTGFEPEAFRKRLAEVDAALGFSDGSQCSQSNEESE
jgi:DnaJ-class molecular chaperone